jgi:Winged helix-turn-helix DNA-binding
MEHTEAIAARLRTQIGELEAELAVHRRALAALGEGPEETPRDSQKEAEPLLGKTLGEARPRRRSAGKRLEREPAGTPNSESSNRQNNENDESDASSSSSREGNGAQGSSGSSDRRADNLGEASETSVDQDDHGDHDEDPEGSSPANEDASADAVLRALRDGHRKPADIASHLGVSVSLVSRRLGELVQSGRIRRRR